MNESQLEIALSGLPLGPLRFFATIGSTNEQALRWVEAGAPHLALLVAGEQTAGRGRAGRRWYTPPDSALAFSLVLRGQVLRIASGDLGRLAALGALAVCEALRQEYGLPVEIKWPNDVLATRRKLAGVLAEASWRGEQLTAIVLGIGVNVTAGSLPPEEHRAFPATSVELVLERRVDRLKLLRAILEAILGWLPRVNTNDFIQAWQEQLAFLGEPVRLIHAGNSLLEGQVAGLTSEGFLRLQTSSGEMVTVPFGEIQLRPGEQSPA